DCLITSKWQLVNLAGEYRPKISTGWPMQSWEWAKTKREMNGKTLVPEITPEGRPRQLLEQGLSAETRQDRFRGQLLSPNRADPTELRRDRRALLEKSSVEGSVCRIERV
ncbi:hypothetical protein FOZ62_016512, partial [Perkinsus olseni]